jgi:hypothetical protein
MHHALSYIWEVPALYEMAKSSMKAEMCVEILYGHSNTH